MDLIARRREIIAQDYHAIPAEYRRVDYIGAENNNAYIDMGFYLTDELEAEIHYYNDKNEAFVFGVRAGVSSPPYCNINIEGNTNNVRFDYSTAKSQARWSDYKIGKYAFSFKNNIVALENLLNHNTVPEDLPSLASAYTNKPLLLFAVYTGDSVSVGASSGSLRIYSAKFWIGGNLIRNFIPCVRKADNKVGMYDRVTKSFYTNAGVDEFTAAASFTPAAPDIPTSIFVYNASDGYLLSTDSRLYSAQIDEGCSEQLVDGYLRLSAPKYNGQHLKISYVFDPMRSIRSKLKIRIKLLELPTKWGTGYRDGLNLTISEAKKKYIGCNIASKTDEQEKYVLSTFRGESTREQKTLIPNQWYTIEIQRNEHQQKIIIDGGLAFTSNDDSYYGTASDFSNQIRISSDGLAPCTVEIDYIVFYTYDPIE